MAQSTVQYKRSFSGSVGSGMKSVMGGNGRRYYMLEHRVSSKYHKAGETQKIIVDEIELGRDSSCQVRFDESFSTVSRRHAAIVKDGDNWKLVQLSQTNSTYLNGQKIANEWYLQNGDEIQLSTNGPKLGFIVPQGEKSFVKSIGLTTRMNLFREQALRPYKRAIAIISCVFVIALAVGAFFLTRSIQETHRLEGVVAEQKEAFEAEKKANEEALAEMKKKNSNMEKEIKKLKSRKSSNPSSAPTQPPSISSNCDPYVYYIYTISCEISLPDGTKLSLSCNDGETPAWSGTGFLLNNGCFVTARHVVENWYYWKSGSGIDEDLQVLNLVANNGGKVVYKFGATSSSGDFFTFTSDQCHVNRSGDTKGTDAEDLVISLASGGANDYAYFRRGSGQGLSYDSQKSTSLPRNTRLTVLGFPLGLGASSEGVRPLEGHAVTASDGLQQGVIVTTDTDYEHGNSGGPVFVSDGNGNLVVVGIVSAVSGRATGFVVPISCIR